MTQFEQGRDPSVQISLPPRGKCCPIRRSGHPTFRQLGQGLTNVCQGHTELLCCPGEGQSPQGLPGATWHLELTQSTAHPLTPTPTPDDLLVFYLGQPLPDTLITQLEQCGGIRVAAFNPYWDAWGVTIRDPDGYLTVLCQRTWET